MSNTALEVMKAIVDNDGPIDKWVRDEDGDWVKAIIYGVVLKSNFPIITDKSDYQMASITDPNKTKTRPMTPREFAKLVGENMGKYLYKHRTWNDYWNAMPILSSDKFDINEILYAHNTDGELVWMELPMMEGK